MNANDQTDGLKSHGTSLTPEQIDRAAKEIELRIRAEGDKPHATVKRQLEVLAELRSFPLGQFLLVNRGFSGLWTYHIIFGYPQWQQGSKTNYVNASERLYFEYAFTTLATRERFTHFQTELQRQVREGVIMASIGCGVMADLLTLNFARIQDYKLIGSDLDTESLDLTQELAEKKGLSKHVEVIKKDAWKMTETEEFDVLTSSGLACYASDRTEVIKLFKKFNQALKSGGILITSFDTPPPQIDPNSEWNMGEINGEHLLHLNIITNDILQAKWQNYTSTDQMKAILTEVGFHSFRLCYDRARTRPTIIGIK